MRIRERLFEYLTREFGIYTIIELLANHTNQRDMMIEQNDVIIDQNKQIIAALKDINIETLIEQNHKVIASIGNTPSAHARSQQELGIIPQTAICSVCGSHVARFTVVDGSFVCANHLKG